VALSRVEYRVFLKVLLRVFKLAWFEDKRGTEQSKIQGVLESSVARFQTSKV